MHAEDRVIHFSTELLHPPMQHPKARLQQLYYDLAQTRSGYDNTDLNVPGQPRFYSRRGARTQSVVAFLPDRLAIIEEWADIPLPTFLMKVREIAARFASLFGVSAFPVQVATLRSTFALTHYADARMFLLDHVCGLEGRIGPHMGRPIGIGGLRLVLPHSPEHPGDLHIAIESFRHSLNEVLVDVKGVFNKPPVTPDNLDAACAAVEYVRAFITDSIFPFLDQFDTAQEEF